MKIIYDDLCELVEVAIKCNETASGGNCDWCPFCDRCQTDTLETRHVLCAEIEGYTKLAEKGRWK